MRPTHTHPKDEKYFEKGFDFMLFFTVDYYVMINDDKIWQVKKELNL